MSVMCSCLLSQFIMLNEDISSDSYLSILGYDLTFKALGVFALWTSSSLKRFKNNF